MNRTSSTQSKSTRRQPRQQKSYLDEQQLIEVWNRIAGNDLSFFLEYESQGAWQPAPHLNYLIQKLEEVERGECRRLMVFMPPRHGKSEVVSKKFPAWYLGRNPTKEMILTSYAKDIAADFSKIARDTLNEWGPEIFGIRVASDSGAMSTWGVEGVPEGPNEQAKKYRGGLKAAGAGGAITGRGAHVAVIDDPFKGMEDSSSPTIREKIYQWYKSVLWTRLAPGGAIILVMTRWHEDDLAGRLVEEMQGKDGEQWDIVKFPAVAEETDILGREPGEGLWLPRFGQEYYNKLKTNLGSRIFTALYQQRPSPAEGSMFKRKWFNFYKSPPANFDQILQSWDCTFKDTETADFVVGQVWGKKGAEYYLLHEMRARMDLPETIAAIQNMTRLYPRALTKLVEDKANGPAVIQMLNKKIPGLIPINPEGGKETRAAAVSPLFEAGNVYLPDPSTAPWVTDYIEELVTFPKGKNDDRVDATSQALVRFTGANEPRIRDL
jgi:predicted phage terminase large subunit-like protein